MYLRNVILVFSILIIVLSLSLYFQTAQEMDLTNWEQYRNLKNDESRKHTLATVNESIGPYSLEEMIQERITANRLLRDKTRVMEIGAGNGLTIMELKKKFPEVEFYIINRRKSHSIYRREGLGGTSLQAGIFTQKELKDVELPYLLFRDLDDGNTIPYDENKFDLIFSFHVLPLVKYKFELISETLRILKKEGISLHVGQGELNFFKSGVKLAEREAYHDLKKLGFNIHYSSKFLMFQKMDDNYLIPLSPQFPIPLKSDENENKKLDMSYNLPD